MKILIAEDNHFYRLALRGILTEWGYDVVESRNGGEAYRILCSPDAPKIAILDWMMPEMSGLELCQKVRALPSPEPTYIIILTCLDGKENVINALNAGADDFIQKPFDREQLQARLQVGKRIVGLQTSQTVVYTFAQAVEAKSPYTQGHADRVTHYALALARSAGVADSELDTLRRGALLHDIGKISIPDQVLNKPGELTEAEFDIIKTHPTLGVEIVAPLKSLEDTLPLIGLHHERLDGRGYPNGLADDDIPQLVRILSVADVFDALSSKRPYRSAMSRERSFAILQEDADNGGLDPNLVARFLKLPDETFLETKKKGNLSNYRFRRPAVLPQDTA